MPLPSSENTSSSAPNQPPWPPDRWLRRVVSIEQVLGETIASVGHQKQARLNALQRHQPKQQESATAGEYGLLPKAYQEGALAYLFQTDSEIKRMELCQRLLENLRGFLADLNQELTTLFTDPAAGVFSESYIYRQLLTRISTDINIVQQALLQRRLHSETAEITHQGYVLQVGNMLANQTLHKVKATNLLPAHVTPLTYLQDRIDIRLIPYYDVVLLSIPYGAMNSTCDWLATDYLAIPHEIGHYLYWWGTFTPAGHAGALAADNSPTVQTGREEIVRLTMRETLVKATAAEPEWVQRWLEEIFADAFGCIIAGPVSALGFQELLTSSSPDLLLGHDQDDHAHPFPALRPFIQSAILRKLHHFETAAGALDTSWQQWVAANWPGLEDPLQHVYALGDEISLTGSAIRDHLSRPAGPLDQILDTLADLQPQQEAGCWTGNQTLAAMYESFTSGRFLTPDFVATIPPQKSQSRTMRDRRVDNRDSRLEEIFKGWSTEGPEGANSGL